MLNTFLWHLKQIQILFRCICVYVCFSKTPLACIPSCSFLKFGVPQKGYAPSSTDDTFWSPLSLAPCIFLWDNIGSGWRTYLQDSSRNFYCRTSISLPNVLQQILRPKVRTWKCMILRHCQFLAPQKAINGVRHWKQILAGVEWCHEWIRSSTFSETTWLGNPVAYCKVIRSRVFLWSMFRRSPHNSIARLRGLQISWTGSLFLDMGLLDK